MKKGERLPFTRTQKWWELGSITVLVFWAAYLLRVWDQIPATVPTHFGLTGQINSYGEKSSLLVLPAVALLLYALLLAAELLPALYTMPGRWSGRSQIFAAQCLRTGLCALKFLLVLLFCYLDFCAATYQPLGAWFLPAAAGVLLLPVLVTALRIYRGVKRREAERHDA
ncbi:DUF1648 domain-containing protein [Neobittarella massiliensis]|uniref:DUF1648 domain-containing protein n=1 Tax=Neobittarella massiliensis (ex Bilen et al. 2018) TaxID=2041842 RepID=A0A8J6IN45_9FIRM|nr:DUF1648 domain-containing protein [Neobittarella massiliensis]